jgi:hypothetical protein
MGLCLERAPPRFLIHGSRYSRSFDRRVRHLGIWQVRTPSGPLEPMPSLKDGYDLARSECLDHLFVLRRSQSASATVKPRNDRSHGRATALFSALIWARDVSEYVSCGDRTARSDRRLHTVPSLPQKARRKIVENPFSADGTTFISSPREIFAPD